MSGMNTKSIVRQFLQTSSLFRSARKGLLNVHLELCFTCSRCLCLLRMIWHFIRNRSCPSSMANFLCSHSKFDLSLHFTMSLVFVWKRTKFSTSSKLRFFFFGFTTHLVAWSKPWTWAYFTKNQNNWSSNGDSNAMQ